MIVHLYLDEYDDCNLLPRCAYRNRMNVRAEERKTPSSKLQTPDKLQAPSDKYNAPWLGGSERWLQGGALCEKAAESENEEE
jgi:hypothetical protein